MRKNILLIGAGNIGSRHLQALKKVRLPLNIKVVDPSKTNLKVAEERWQTTSKSKTIHQIEFLNTPPINNKNKIDLAIIATSSDTRAEIIKNLIKNHKVKNLLLEKILFHKKEDYKTINQLLIKQKIKAWVNCPRRAMSWYQKLANQLHGQPFFSHISLGSFGLISNTIHYLDYFSSITKDNNFLINTSGLNKKLINSKRLKFKELTGTIQIIFNNKSSITVTSHHKNNSPILIYIYTSKNCFLINETTGQHYFALASQNWKFKKTTSHLIKQSQLTNKIVEKILHSRSCELTSFTKSVTIHLNFLEPILNYINHSCQKKYKYYPFT